VGEGAWYNIVMALSKSPALNDALASYGITTPNEVLEHLPRRYESYELTPKKITYEDKERLVKYGRLAGALQRPLRFASRVLYRFYFETPEGENFLIEAWNRAYLGQFLKTDEDYTLVGIYEKKRHSISLVNIVKGSVSPEKALRPVYSLPNAVPNRSYMLLVKRCLEETKGFVRDEVPAEFSKKYRLLPHYEALVKVHEPETYEDVHQGLRTLKYEDALAFSLATQLVRKANKALRKDRRRQIDQEKLASFIKTLPYKLTPDQEKALNEALKDMDSPAVMYRLLQGDVGTGKTLVAALCAYANYTRSEQTAFLAPTDTLARQHYETLSALFKDTHLRVALLVGALSAPERAAVLQDLADGTIDLVVGTHALFSKDVQYAYLGLAIIDEQHKFGVNQRTLLVDKGEHADLLLMSATPIPRTLSLTIYGDLDISSLYLFPSGKRKVLTSLVEEGDPAIKKTIDVALKSQHRVFVVVPQINGQAEATSVLQMSAKYKRLYPGLVTMMHGQMEEIDKETAVAAFKTGLCPIMVATSLIEVGIDIKEANTMVVYAPTHFALSSLHQLRGRIGRDGSPASFLMVDDGSEEEEKEKLKVLLSTDDGFKIAEEDLKLRGPGEIAGTKQSGLPDFRYANIIDDFKIFECARDDAAYILAHQDKYEYARILEKALKATETSSLA
jgi:ATP-dependent DNA helicase RecG